MHHPVRSLLLSALAASAGAATVAGVAGVAGATAAAAQTAPRASRTSTVPALPALGFFANQVPVNAAGEMVTPTNGTQPTPAGYASGSAADSAVTSYTASVASTPNWHPAVLNSFFDWQDNATSTTNYFGTYEAPVPGTVETPAQFVYYAVNTAHAVPLLTWQPDIMTSTASSGRTNPACENDPDTTTALAEINSGDCDQYISNFAQALAGTGQTVYLRFMHEMNSGTYPWGCGYNRSDPSSPLGCTAADSTAAAYVQAYQHVWTLFQEAGATNVEFVWCVNSSGPDAVVPVSAFFPGDQYMSWTAVDGYNRDTADPTSNSSLDSIFSYDYNELAQISTRPVMISEVNTWDTVSDLPPSGGPFGTIQSTPAPSFSKANWMTTGLETAVPQNFPRVRAVLFFDALGNGFSYPFTSSPAALGAWKNIVDSGDYSETAPTSTLVYCSSAAATPVVAGTCATPSQSYTGTSAGQPGAPASVSVCEQAAGDPAPTGSVTFTGVGSAQTVTLFGACATVDLTLGTAPGDETETASYSGDGTDCSTVATGGYCTSPQSSFTIEVFDGTTTALTSSANPVHLAVPVTFTATVSTADGSAATGAVTFTVGTTTYPAVTVVKGKATLTLSFEASGPRTVTADFDGTGIDDSSLSPKMTETVLF